MKKSVADFMKANGFYLSFGVGVVALVAALAVYNVNTSRKNQQQSQEINLNDPAIEEFADAEATEEVQETIVDGDMDVPADMWSTEETTETEEETASDMTVGSTQTEQQDTAAVISGQTVAYQPLDGLSFHGTEEVSMPVLGNTILPFSMDTTVYFQTLGTYRCNPGMLLQAPTGTEVVSVWHGQVTDIQETKEYGQTVTVDLGSGYAVTYGQLQDVRVELGDEVWKDTILGEVGTPTAYYEKEGEHLYLAMTKDGTPMNPMEMLQVE